MPVSTMTPIFLSQPALRKAWISSSTVCALKALSTFGRLMVMVATPFSSL